MPQKCWVLLVNRNLARIYRRARFEAAHGEIRGLFSTKLKFFISDKVAPLSLDLSSPRNKNKMMPLWVVNEMTSNAIGVTMIEKSDVDAYIKLNLLTKLSFWAALARKAKVSKTEILVFMFAGFGALRFIEYLVRIVILHQG